MMENRPKLKIELTTADQILECLGWFILLFLWGLAIYNYSSLPKIIPIHFNASGQADGFGNKSNLLLLPIIGTILFIGLTVLNKFPHIFNYLTTITPENAHKQYSNATRMMRVLKLLVLIIFTGIVWITITTAKGKSTGLSSWFLPIVLGSSFFTTTYFLYKSVQFK